MKRRGFTLIELLAVIVILSVIGLITIPLIGNIIEDSKKKALEQSVYGIVEAANYFALENTGEHHFIFDEINKTQSTTGKFLSYKGQIDAEGELYIDNDGNISLCFMNENYYVYKNYNSGIYIGNISENTCIVDYDAITNKYIAMLDDGTGQISNVYSKEQVNSLVTNLQSQIYSNDTDIEGLNSNVNTLTSIVNSNSENITNLQNDLTNYALQSDLDTVNNNLSSLGIIKLGNTNTGTASKGTVTKAGSLTLPAGVWMIVANLRWGMNVTGDRSIAILTGGTPIYHLGAYMNSLTQTAAINGAKSMNQSVTTVVYITEEQTFDLWCQQTSEVDLGYENVSLKGIKLSI